MSPRTTQGMPIEPKTWVREDFTESGAGIREASGLHPSRRLGRLT